jgi:hypothetical protein
MRTHQGVAGMFLALTTYNQQTTQTSSHYWQPEPMLLLSVNESSGLEEEYKSYCY